MEYGLRPYVDLDETLYYLSVLILVLMEYGLRREDYPWNGAWHYVS